ncbi:MAG: S26 family signal peptidase, partial [Gemmataceae bacterium]
LVWKLAWGGPRAGDVIVLASPVDGRRLVKRVAAVDGDRLYVAGDNPAQSVDSRSFGWVPRSAVVGRVVRVWRRP